MAPTTTARAPDGAHEVSDAERDAAFLEGLTEEEREAAEDAADLAAARAALAEPGPNVPLEELAEELGLRKQDTTPENDAARLLLERAIRASGLSDRRFAVEVLAGRGERTVRRWLAGDGPIPPGVRKWLEARSEDYFRLIGGALRGK